MTLVTRLRRLYRFEVHQLPSGLCLNLIEAPQYFRESFSIAIAANFGSAHLECENGKDKVLLPEGAAHLVEHLLYIGAYPDYFREYDQEIFHRLLLFNLLSARVDRYQTYWYLQDVPLENIATQEAIQAAIHYLFTILIPQIRASSLPALMDKARNEVRLESAYRSSNDMFFLPAAMFRNLYPSHPLGADPLGTTESLQQMDASNQLIALNAFHNSITSITLLVNELTPAISEIVKEEVQKRLSGTPTDSSWRVARSSTPPPPAKKRTIIEQSRRTAKVIAGFELPPLQVSHPNRQDLARMLLLTHLATLNTYNPVSCVFGPESRVYLASSDFIKPWLMDHDVRLSLLAGLCSRLKSSGARSEGWMNGAIMPLVARRHAMMRLCHVGGLHGITLDELLRAVDDVGPEHIETILTELQSPLKSSQVYVGPPMPLS